MTFLTKEEIYIKAFLKIHHQSCSSEEDLPVIDDQKNLPPLFAT